MRKTARNLKRFAAKCFGRLAADQPAKKATKAKGRANKAAWKKVAA